MRASGLVSATKSCVQRLQEKITQLQAGAGNREAGLAGGAGRSRVLGGLGFQGGHRVEVHVDLLTVGMLGLNLTKSKLHQRQNKTSGASGSPPALRARGVGAASREAQGPPLSKPAALWLLTVLTALTAEERGEDRCH